MAGPPKILLLQARLGDDPVRDEERQAFANKAGIPLDCFTPHDLLSGPPSFEEISRYDALMVGGSGEFYVSKGNFPGFTDLLGVLRRQFGEDAEQQPLHFKAIGDQSGDLGDYPKSEGPLCKYNSGQCNFYDFCFGKRKLP